MNRKAMCPVGFAAATAAMFISGAPLLASEHDDRIESSFQKSYVYETYLKEDDVKIAALDGVVTLSGTVAQESRKALAQETAASLPGVIRVDNRLTTRAEAEADSVDKKIARNVNLSLMFHRNVNAGKTVIDVNDGIVTLTGDASSLAQKELTAEYASDIEGVKEVKNQMTVVADPDPAERAAAVKMDDASITAQVRTALSTHRSTSSLKTQVETRNGTVTLSGIARNSAERSLITKLVTDIQGVTGVNNQMTVAEVSAR